MCGIAGVISNELPPSDTVDIPMASSIRYRGRDGNGRWSDGRRVLLFHSRLAIIALDDGAQPMRDVGGRYTIVYNGEIYNYLELRQLYAEQGARFATSSDTEIILEGFRLKGANVCRDLNGMFAFAIWDAQEQTLFLARDRLGKKPLFWVVLQGKLYFSSTLDLFRELPGWSGRLHASAISLYARLGCFPNELCVYEQAKALPPGSYAFARADGNEPRVTRYWQLCFADKFKMNLNEAADAYEALLTDAIRIRLRADVPLTLTFSGGVDSGTIAALAKRRLNVDLSCYTIDYDSPEDRSPETAIAQAAARHLDLEWTHLQYDYRNILFEDAIDAVRAFDQPCSQLAMAYSQRLYNSIRPHAKVALCGAGADELFTGYSGDEHIFARDRTHPFAQMAPRWLLNRLPRTMQSLLNLHFTNSNDFARYQGDYLKGGLGDCAPDDAALTAVIGIMDAIEKSEVETHLDLRQFMSTYFFGAEANFRLPDITGLRAQVEVRSPFLDYRLVEFAARLPGHLKVGDVGSSKVVKFLPRTVYARYVPEEIAWSSKEGHGDERPIRGELRKRS